ncbi:hypothetical protein [Limnovirga soli]|jgi:hypothetical protein|uniref:Uncharacterized protein n=1 Tax=Limnovirga soli TaxID=2656915 RepID=A0A8J8FJS5_9BACT|nr:hypothetical protein [Limnovirga soli]NNV57151.1 hypothetical protein [Limnovirga soli]
MQTAIYQRSTQDYANLFLFKQANNKPKKVRAKSRLAKRKSLLVFLVSYFVGLAYVLYAIL